MSTPTPTPRTDAQNFGASCATDFCRTLERENAALRENCEAHEKYAHMMQEQRSQIAAYCRTLERELAAERARLDWLMAGGVCMVQHTGGFHVSRLHAPVSRAAIDAAMKEETK